MVQKNEDISESVNSIDSGAIFPPSSGHDRSRNTVGVSVYAFERNLYCRIGFFVTPKSRDFHDFSSFLESSREAFGKLFR